MWQIIKRNPTAVVIAVAMHAAIVALFLVGVDWLKRPDRPKPSGPVVQARVVDQAKVEAEVRKLKQAEEKKQSARLKEEKRLAELKRRQAKEKRRLAELEKKRKAEAKRRAEAKKRAEAETRRLAQLKQEQATLERKRREEERRLADAKRKAEAERKRKEQEALAAEQKAREEALQAEMEAERLAREFDRFYTSIKQKVERNWLRPTTVGTGLSCELRVRLIPGGGVATVSISRSSGNGAFDRSVEKAVYKADPLPVPEGAGFEQFRELNLVFDPSKK